MDEPINYPIQTENKALLKLREMNAKFPSKIPIIIELQITKTSKKLLGVFLLKDF